MAIFDYFVNAIGFLTLLYFTKVVAYSVFIAYHGPLSEIPGPFWYKFSFAPWMTTTLRGKCFSEAQKFHMKYGDVVRLGPKFLSFRDRDSIRKIVQEWDLPKSAFYERFRSHDDINTLLTERDKIIYRHKRRLLSPGFSISYLKAQEPLVLECCDVLREVLDEACHKAPEGKAIIDAYGLLADLGIDVITASAFGGSFGLVRNKHHDLRILTTKFFKASIFYGTFGFLKHLPGSKKRREDPKLFSMLDDILRRRLAMEKKFQRKDLLQIFLDAHEQDPKAYTFEHVKAEMLLFLLAGSETTTSLLAFALLFLVHNDRARKIFMRELDEAFPNKQDAITIEKTKDLPYLHAVTYETLRLMPPVANGLPRVTDRTVTLNGYTLPPQTYVSGNNYPLQHDPKVWGPDVETFRPERWLEPGGEELLKSSMFAFSAGSRSCIGKNFAMMEIEIILPTLIRHYDVSLVPDQDLELQSTITLSFKSGHYHIGIQQRD